MLRSWRIGREAASNSPLYVVWPHIEVSISEDAEVAHRHQTSDTVTPSPECAPWYSRCCRRAAARQKSSHLLAFNWRRNKALLSLVHTSNNVERVFREISFFWQSQNKLNMFSFSSAGNWHGFLNQGTVYKFDRAGFLIFGLVFVSRDFEFGRNVSCEESTVSPVRRVIYH